MEPSVQNFVRDVETLNFVDTTCHEIKWVSLFLVANSAHSLSHSIPSADPIFKVNSNKSYMSKREI